MRNHSPIVPPAGSAETNPCGGKIALTVNEFLDIANIGRTKFYDEVKKGRIRVVKVGAKTLVPATEPAAWLARLAKQEC